MAGVVLGFQVADGAGEHRLGVVMVVWGWSNHVASPALWGGARYLAGLLLGMVEKEGVLPRLQPSAFLPCEAEELPPLLCSLNLGWGAISLG